MMEKRHDKPVLNKKCREIKGNENGIGGSYNKTRACSDYLRTGQGIRQNSLLPPQRDASAHPGMTDLIVIPVLHADALDEFPKHRQELLDLGKGCWKLANDGTHQGTKVSALKL